MFRFASDWIHSDAAAEVVTVVQTAATYAEGPARVAAVAYPLPGKVYMLV